MQSLHVSVTSALRLHIHTPQSWIAAGVLFTVFLHKHVLRGDVAVLLGTAFFSVIFSADFFLLGIDVFTSCRLAASAIFYLLFSIVLTTIAYRLSPLHPLWNFDGPLINKITSLRMMYVVWSGKRHLYIDSLHKKYGTFVRTGPNTLSINSHEAIGPIYASASALDKSAAYTPGRLKGDGLFFIRSKVEHNARRRLWAGAFTPQALEVDKLILEKRTSELKACIKSRRDKNDVVDLGEAVQHWSYAVMGDLTFGGSDRLELMRDGDAEGLVESGHKATMTFEFLGEVPSIFDILSYFPPTGKLKRLERVAEELLVHRERNNKLNANDIVSHLLGYHSSLPPLNFIDRRIDTLFAIQAGSDTTSTVIIYLLFLVISNKHAYECLKEELDANFSDPDEPISIATLASLPYLNAVISEALRLGSPFPGWPRVTPKGGMVIAGRYIPGEMIVGVNPYVQGTSAENFYPEPLSYKPERWLPGGLGPDTLTRKSAIMSFSFGAFGCLGRNLAILELQIVTVRLMLAYDFALTSTFDTQKFLDGVENMRTTHFRYPLKVLAIPRT